MEQTIMDIMGLTFDNLKKLSGGGNVMGDPVRLDEKTVAVPYCKVSLGFVYGGGEYGGSKSSNMLRLPFATAGGGGVTLTPCGFLIAEDGEYKLVAQEEKGEENKWVSLAKAVLNVMKKS